MRVFITGGAGFVGSHLTDAMLARGHEVVVADNFSSGSFANLEHLSDQPRLTIVRQDMTQPLATEITRHRYDRVYNLASPASPRGYLRYPIETLLVNSLGTWQALELARKHGARFLQASTSEVYGDPLAHPQPEDYWGNVNPIGPRACYDEGKRYAEALVMEYHRQHRLDVRIARIFNTYGPRSMPSDGRVVPSFCMQALAGIPLTVFGDGSQTRSFCFISDLVRGFELLMETDGLAGQVVNLGNPEEYTILEFALRIISLAGSSSPVHYGPLPADDPQRRRPDIAIAHRLLGWQPEVTLEQGLHETLAFFRVTTPPVAPVVPLVAPSAAGRRYA